MSYTLYVDGHVQRDDGLIIPPDVANLDWQAYLAWTDAGNTASPAPSPPAITVISAGAFLARFTDAEQLAVQQAAATSAPIALGLTIGLATGTIQLVGDATVSDWMDALVTAGAITADRRTEILTP